MGTKTKPTKKIKQRDCSNAGNATLHQSVESKGKKLFSVHKDIYYTTDLHKNKIDYKTDSHKLQATSLYEQHALL